MAKDTVFGFASYAFGALTVTVATDVCAGTCGIGCVAAAPLVTIDAPGAFAGGWAAHYLVLQELEHYEVWEGTP